MDLSSTVGLSGERLGALSITLRCSDGPDDEWLVASCYIDEQLDEPYRVEVDLASAAPVDVKALLGADAELLFARDGDERRSVYGVVSRVEDLGTGNHRQHLRLQLLPALAFLGEGKNSRIWQQASVQDIVKQVLGEGLGPYGRSVDLGAVSRGASPRDYCVQYRESDLDFVSRLLEEEGIAFDFVHESGAGMEKLCLRDAGGQYDDLENVDGSNEVPLIADRADEADAESVQELALAGELTVTAILHRDYEWLTPTSLLTEAGGGADERGRERRIYSHMRRRYIEDDLGERVADLLAAEQAGAVILHGSGNVVSFVPGGRFALTNASPELEGEYLLTQVVHEFTHNGEGPPTYHNRFRCIPAEVEYRPRQRTPKPRVHGPQTATVVGDDEIHTDEHGRIQVQFHWQEQPSYASDASCWIRCAQPWSGPGWGVQFIPRVGMEVVVEFLEGNPDRPLVTGCVYNGDNGYPFALPDNKTQSGWRSSSSPGGDGYNMLRFEDAAGKEQIHLHGQKDWDIVIENDKSSLVKHDEGMEVSNDRTKLVGHDEDETIGNDRSIAVGNNHTEKIGVDMELVVGSNQTEIVGANQTELVGANQTSTIAANKTITVGGMLALSVGSSMAVVVAGSGSEGVSESKTVNVGADSAEDVVGTKSVQAENINESADKDMQIKLGKKFRLEAGDDMSFEGGKKGSINVADKLVLSCGKAQIILQKNGDIKIKGKKILIEGSGDVKVKGSKVGLN